MSNRQKATHPWLGRNPRPAGAVYSATHGAAWFNTPKWFRAHKMRPCRDKTCGIASTSKSNHVHPRAQR